MCTFQEIGIELNHPPVSLSLSERDYHDTSTNRNAVISDDLCRGTMVSVPGE